MPDDDKRTTSEKPLSLHPLTTEEALRRALQAPKPAKRKRPKKPA